MSARPPSNTIEQMAPLLGSLARLIASGTVVNEAALHTLLSGVDLAPDPGIVAEMDLWTKLLRALYDQPELRLVRGEALLMRGLPEASVLLAVATVTDGPHHRLGMPIEKGFSSLSVSVEHLDFGTLALDQPAWAEFTVYGGPGRVVVDSVQVRVVPAEFGSEKTAVMVEVRPAAEAVLWSTLRLITVGETLEIPLIAQWQAVTKLVPASSESMTAFSPFTGPSSSSALAASVVTPGSPTAAHSLAILAPFPAGAQVVVGSSAPATTPPARRAFTWRVRILLAGAVLASAWLLLTSHISVLQPHSPVRLGLAPTTNLALTVVRATIPTASVPPTGLPIVGMAPFAGTWIVHAADLDISTDGTTTIVARTYNDCGSDGVLPCDTMKGNLIIWGIKVTARILSVDGTTAHATITASTVPDTIGKPLTFKIMPHRRLDIYGPAGWLNGFHLCNKAFFNNTKNFIWWDCGA